MKTNFSSQTTVVRTFRIGRIFKLLRTSKSLRIIFQTFLTTLPSFVNLGALLLIFIYIYVILGVYMFSSVMVAPPLNEHANFKTVYNAFYTLIRIATGENYHDILHSIVRTPSIKFQCIHNPSYEDYANAGNNTVGCGLPLAGEFYFVSYILVVTFIFLNFFIAIILETFQNTNQETFQVLNNDLQDHFKEVWSKYDPEALGFIEVMEFTDFLIDLGPPLGWDEDYICSVDKQKEFL